LIVLVIKYSGLESIQGSLDSGELNLQWLGEWEDYMELFQVGGNQFGCSDIGQTTDCSGYTGRVEGLMYT
jgi:hypothetical protein